MHRASRQSDGREDWGGRGWRAADASMDHKQEEEEAKEATSEGDWLRS